MIGKHKHCRHPRRVSENVEITVCCLCNPGLWAEYHPGVPRPKPLPKKKRKPNPHNSPSPELEAKKAAARAEAASNKIVKVCLLMQHTRNGQSWGPGWVQIPQCLADDFKHTEDVYARKADENFFGNKSVIIGPQRGTNQNKLFTTRQVADELFDSQYAGENPTIALSISGKKDV